MLIESYSSFSVFSHSIDIVTVLDIVNIRTHVDHLMVNHLTRFIQFAIACQRKFPIGTTYIGYRWYARIWVSRSRSGATNNIGCPLWQKIAMPKLYVCLYLIIVKMVFKNNSLIRPDLIIWLMCSIKYSHNKPV